jgi:hypothetical protein
MIGKRIRLSEWFSPGRFNHCAAYQIDLLLGQFRVHRQAKHMGRHSLCHRQRLFWDCKILVCWLPVQRDRIMNSGSDSLFLHFGLHRIAVPNSHDEKVPYGFCMRINDGQNSAAAAQYFYILSCMPLPRGVPRVEIP